MLVYYVFVYPSHPPFILLDATSFFVMVMFSVLYFVCFLFSPYGSPPSSLPFWRLVLSVYLSVCLSVCPSVSLFILFCKMLFVWPHRIYEALYNNYNKNIKIFLFFLLLAVTPFNSNTTCCSCYSYPSCQSQSCLSQLSDQNTVALRLTGSRLRATMNS
jgi:hypothetical protein